MAKLTVTLEGLDELGRALQRSVATIQTASAGALRADAERTVQLAADRLPERWSDLVSSVEIAVNRDGSVDVGYTAPYAEAVHEDPDSPAFKFLEQAVAEVEAERERRWARTVGEALER
jgi:hypothetical protein